MSLLGEQGCKNFIMVYERDNRQLDAEIHMLEMQIARIKIQTGNNQAELEQYEAILNELKKKKNDSGILRTLRDADMHQVSGRVWSVNEGCFIWQLIFWAICFLLSLPFLLSH